MSNSNQSAGNPTESNPHASEAREAEASPFARAFTQPWQFVKQAYDAWDSASAPMFETMLKSPMMVGPAGDVLSATAKVHSVQQRFLGAWWSAWGLPTREDQERSMHAMNELQSRLIDLEEKLAELEAKKS